MACSFQLTRGVLYLYRPCCLMSLDPMFPKPRFPKPLYTNLQPLPLTTYLPERRRVLSACELFLAPDASKQDVKRATELRVEVHIVATVL